MSPEIAARIEKNPVRRNIRYNEDQNSCILIDNPIPNICESVCILFSHTLLGLLKRIT